MCPSLVYEDSPGGVGSASFQALVPTALSGGFTRKPPEQLPGVTAVMTAFDRAALRVAGERLQALASDLRRRGFGVQLVATDARRDLPPGRLCLWISSQADTASFEVVYAAPAYDGAWWLWWPETTRLIPLHDVATAAARIEQVMPDPPGLDGSSYRERQP